MASLNIKIFKAALLYLILITEIKPILASKSEKRLRTDVFKKHMVDVRPVIQNSDAVAVGFSLQINQLLQINEEKNFIEMAAVVKQTWVDYQLTWNSSDYGNITSINIDPVKVWRPDIMLTSYINDGNAEHGGYLKRLKPDAILYSDGQIVWDSRMVLKTNCEIDVHRFPNDHQTCTFRFESYTYPSSKMTIEVDKDLGIGMEWYQKNIVWKLLHARHTTTPLSDSGHEYSAVEFHFTFKRNQAFYGLLLTFSISLITALMIFTFILPEESGERMGVALTLMLASMVFILLVAENVPVNIGSGSVPLLAIFFGICLVLMAVIIIMLSFVSKIYHQEEEDGPMSEWTRRNILGRLSYVVGARQRKAGKKGRVNALGENVTDKGESMEANADGQDNGICGEKDHLKVEWRIVGKTIDRCLFMLFSLVLLIGVAVCFGR